MTIACSTSASASRRRSLPRARATAEEMPPPMAPADSIVIIMKPGKTSAMPVNASVPRCEIHQVSIRPVEACAIITRTFGQASSSSVAMIGPCSRRLVRGLIACVGAGTDAGAGTAPVGRASAATAVLKLGAP